MTTISLHYDLSESAMRAELGAGRPAHKSRVYELAPTPELAAIAEIDSQSGAAKIVLRSTGLNSRGDVTDYSGYASVVHVSDSVFASQDEAVAWIGAQRRAVEAKGAELKAQHEASAREQAAREAAARERLSARVLAVRADDVLDADGAEIGNRIPYHSRSELTDEAAKHVDAIRAERDARRAAAKARAKANAEDLRAWAAEHAPEARIARAAREGRDVTSAIDALVSERVTEALEGCLANTPFAVVSTYDSQPRTDVPTAAAYELLDLLATPAVRSAVLNACALPHAEVEVGPIMRFDVAESGSAVWRTGVRLTLRHPWLVDAHTQWSVLAEPLALGDDDDE
jgi:hypothetical protein